MTHHFAENTIDSTTKFTSVDILSSQKKVLIILPEDFLIKLIWVYKIHMKVNQDSFWHSINKRLSDVF